MHYGKEGCILLKKKFMTLASLRVILILFLPAACLILLVSCASTDYNLVEGIKLYYINSDENMVVSEQYKPTAADTKGLIAEMIEALNIPPMNDKYKKAKPDQVLIIDYSYEAGKPLTINFENSYNILTGTTEVLCRAAIVNTFCQIEGVDLVEFYVRGQPLVLSGEVPVGIMSAEDFIIADDAFLNNKEEAVVTLYFANDEGNKLLPYPVNASYGSMISTEQLIVILLLKGPKDEGFNKTIPDGTKINKISVLDTVCYIDLSSEFMEKRQGVSEEVTIYSIVNSLAEYTSVTHVQFLINGEKKKSYQNLDFSGLFERNLSLIDNE